MVGLLTHGLDFFFMVFFFFNLLSFSLLRFVIELCEPIQVKQLDIANFELFSSTPKDFLVSISDRYTYRDRVFFVFCFFFHLHNSSQHYILHNISCSSFRYPTSKWVKLGTFHARDERIVQSFPLDEQLFAKYLKVVFLFLLCMKSVIMFEGGSSTLINYSVYTLLQLSVINNARTHLCTCAKTALKHLQLNPMDSKRNCSTEFYCKNNLNTHPCYYQTKYI